MEHMTRDEFLYKQLKGNRSVYRGIAIAYAAAAIAAFIMAIALLLMHRFGGLLALAVMGLGMAGSAATSWSQHKVYADALEEIGPDPTGVDTCCTYSRRTANAIAQSRTTTKILAQQWISYGIIAITMIGLGVFLVVILLDMEEDLALTLLGAGLTAGGALLLFLAIKVFLNWRVAKHLELFE